jgi:hypothetical protein
MSEFFSLKKITTKNSSQKNSKFAPHRGAIRGVNYETRAAAPQSQQAT